MTTEIRSSRRVLLLAGCFADAAPSIDLAVALAMQMQASLEGVLALDPRAEGAALVRTGPQRREDPPLNSERLRRACAADARAFRRRLDLAAARASLRWSLRTDTGLLPELALELRQPGDAVILGHRRFLALRGPVISLDSGESGPTAQLAADLARRLGLHARLLPTDTTPAQIDLLAASLIVLPKSLQENRPRLNVLIEAARCPVLLGATE